MIHNRKANVVVIGGGYVGLPLAILSCRAGFNTKIYDINPSRVDEINSGDRPIGFPTDVVEATTDPTCISTADVVIVCVPTPVDQFRKPDLTALNSAVDIFLENAPVNQCLFSIESTVYPGFTQSLSDRIGSAKCLVCFSSERINPGTPFEEFKKTPKVVGPTCYASGVLASRFYKCLFDSVHTTKSSIEAEMSKLLENSYRAVNISMINEFASICNDLKIDIWDVVSAAATKPFGFSSFKPGPGIGGHCISVDPYYLLDKVHESEISMPILESAMRTNEGWSSTLADRIFNLTKSRKALVVGVTYKPDIPDTRESPAIKLIDVLESRGYDVSYFDPIVADLNGYKRSVESDTYGVSIIAALHKTISIEEITSIISRSSIVFDLTNSLPTSIVSDKIIKL